MPRSNIPYRSMGYFSNRKRTSFSRTHRTTSDTRLGDSQQGSSCPVNNILVFPKNSETTINVLGTNSQSLPYGNLLKKIKGRKRKEKQRLKKKHNFEGDVKPVINEMTPLKSEKLKSRMNKHIIFLSDSDNENSEIDHCRDVNDTSVLGDNIAKSNCKNDEDDDVIFVETPAAEIIEIDDTTEQTETPKRTSDSSNVLEKSFDQVSFLDANDFLDNTPISLKSKFNFELHGSEFKGAEFLKPSTVPKDMSESGSVSSVSDVSATIGMNVFNVVDFPQEKVNLFDDTNLEKFRNAITPQRSNKKSKSVEKFDHSDQRENQNDSLPTLCDIQVEENNRKRRGRSIIKELVNDRAYVLLSAAQKKFKHKKRRTKDGASDTLEEESQNDDTQESNKKKKKKKYKKRDASPNEKNLVSSRIDIVDEKNKKRKEGKGETSDGASKHSIAIRTDLFEPAESEISNHLKKSKKNKRLDSEAPNYEEDIEKKKRKIKRNMEEIFDDTIKMNMNEQDGDITEDNEEKRKKKNKKTCDISFENSKSKIEQQGIEENSIQENSEEKKKKKSKRNIEVSTDVIAESNGTEFQQSIAHVREDEAHEEKKKKKCRRISEVSSEISAEKKKSEQQWINYDVQENNEEKRKKKNRKPPATPEKVVVNTDQNMTRLEEISEERREIMKQIEVKEDYDKTVQPDIEKDFSENIEEKRKRKTKKEVSTQINPSEIENLMQSAKFKTQDKNENGKEKTETIMDECTRTRTEEAFAKEFDKKQEKRKDAKIPKESTAIDHKNNETICQDIQMIQVVNETSEFNSVLINIPDTAQNETLQKSKLDVPNKNEEQSRLNSKRTSEPPETIVKKLRVEEHNVETVVKGYIEEETKIYEGLQEMCMEKKADEMEVQNQNIANDTQNQLVEKIYTEHIFEALVENNLDSLRKRKKESSISEYTHDPAESIDPKRIKIVAEIQQPQLEEGIENEKRLFENSKEEVYIDEISCKKDDNVSVAVNEEEILKQPRVIENVENSISRTVENLEVYKSVDSMLVIDNEGNIDMKLTNVFSSGNKSIFPEEISFADDLNLDNFLDKNNSSWNADPSRFYSYNASLFNDVNRQTSLEISNQDSNLESNSAVTATTPSELLESQTNPNFILESIVPSNSTLHNLNETIVVKNEIQIGIDTVRSEITTDISSQGDVTVKTETESEDMASTIVEQSGQIIPELKKNPSDSGLDTGTPLIILNQELPDEIEEIVKEKENHDTVKRLCEFLEEAKDPNDVLKKVSLLKKAFKEKSQNLPLLNEEVQISYDNDDVFSISSNDSSVVCLEDDVSVVSIEDDIILANCDVADGEKNENEPNNIFNSQVDSRGDSNEVIIKSIEEQNDKIENVASTSKSILNSTSISSETQHNKKGLDKFEVEDIQKSMSSDPKLWKIVSEDIYPNKFPTKGKRCIKCKEIGHLGYNCPNKLNLPKCSLCGGEGHLDFRCPKKLCTQCGKKAPMMQHICNHCKHYRNLTCALCRNKGHPKNKCPDLWRRYHLTVNHGPLVHRDTLVLKSKGNLWCSSCANSGHVEYQCPISTSWRNSMNFQLLDPRIYHYDDVYNVNPVAIELKSVQGNAGEVPQTSQTLLNNDDNNSGTSSLTTSINDMVNPSQSTPFLSLDKTTEEDQAIKNKEQDLQGLSPEVLVTNKVNAEKKDTDLNTSDKRYQNFFMTASIESLKHFVNEEILVLESNKFKLQHLRVRFIAFQQDNELPAHKSRFGVHRKEKFYKQLNMLIFGKLQVKSGKVYLDKLKNFVKRTPGYLSTSMRESLWYYYDYIFRTAPHNYVNYMFFLKMLRTKYGDKKWLY